MNRRRCIGLVCVSLAVVYVGDASAQQEKPESAEVVKIGVVGSGNNKTFEKLISVLNRKGYPSTHVLYPTYDAMVDALDAGEIDIAWNSPLAHAQYHVRNQCRSQTLAMRDTDVGLKVVLIADHNSGIKSLDDLAGKRVIVGRQKYHEGMLSAHFLKKGMADFDQVTIVQLDEKDAEGNRADTSSHILQALALGQGDAAVVPLGFWNRSTQWKKEHPGVGQVWKSPEFNHCVFTAAADFNAQLASQFTKLMTTLDPNDPLVAQFNRAERTKTWLPGDASGFESLVEAIQESKKE